MSAFTPSNTPCENTGASVAAMTAMTRAYSEMYTELEQHEHALAGGTPDVHGIKSYVGNISALNTDTQNSVVSAINEVNTRAKNTARDQGNVLSLTTSDTTSVVAAINEVNTKTSNLNNKIGVLPGGAASVADALQSTNSNVTNAVNTANTASTAASAATTNVNALTTKVGVLSALNTQDKTSTVAAINEVNSNVSGVDDKINRINDGSVCLNHNTINFEKTVDVYARYVGGSNYCLGYIDGKWDDFDASGDNGPNENTTKIATIYIKHIDSKQFDACVTAMVTCTGVDEYSAGLIVHMSKGLNDWNGLKFKIVKATSSDSKPYFYLVIDHPDLVPSVVLNDPNDPNLGIQNVVNMSFRINGINFVPVLKDTILPGATIDNELIVKTIGVGTEFVTLEGLHFNSVADLPSIGDGTNRIATMDDIQVATAGVPTGAIIRWGSWSGTVPNNPPTGYVACSGLVVNNSMPEWDDYKLLMVAYGYDPNVITTFTLPDEENSLVKIS